MATLTMAILTMAILTMAILTMAVLTLAVLTKASLARLLHTSGLDRVAPRTHLVSTCYLTSPRILDEHMHRCLTTYCRVLMCFCTCQVHCAAEVYVALAGGEEDRSEGEAASGGAAAVAAEGKELWFLKDAVANAAEP